MADLTLTAIEPLLGLLTTAVKDEARLLRGVQGDIQFIKDEMDSMNGFLMHLTKTQTEHNDQHRAWMKQVRDISYVAQDCIELYLRDLTPPEDGFLAFLAHLPTLICTCCKRRDLAKELRELKDRVREVGERRLRYGVSVPETAKYKPEQDGKDSKVAEEKRDKFLHALEEDANKASPPSFDKAISLLPGDLNSEAKRDEINEILQMCVDFDCKKMFLCALFAYPYVSKEELKTSILDKKNKLTMEGSSAVDDAVRKEVMLFSYSKLSTHYKGCLQYLTAFSNEKSISRTSLVRRWAAEGLVARDDGNETMEEAGERCFDELVFRGFVRPVTPAVPGLKIKSCHVEGFVWDFIFGMAKSENLVGALPTHLRHQHSIREIAQRELLPQHQQERQRPSPLWNICPRIKQRRQYDDDNMAVEDKRNPMDDLAHLLKNLPEEYRLNVLDLGGCTALKDRHLQGIISKVPWLKYLSVRNTQVSRLPKEINKLRRLETLDIRQTKIKDAGTKHIVLLRLKHLLAGNINKCHENESLSTVQMPRKIGMTTEVLRHVQILKGKAELAMLTNLKQLRKLGVVIEGSTDNMKCLPRAIEKLSECLRSLSVWINMPTTDDTVAGNDSGFILGDDNNEKGGTNDSLSPKNLQSLNIKSYFKKDGPGGKLPPWIKGLNRLSKVTLRDTRLSESSMKIFGQLESLRCLRLRRGSYNGTSIILHRGEFQKLRFLMIDQVTATTRIEFHEHAAPELEKITWTVDERMEAKEDTLSGIKYLDNLKELELNGDWVDLQGHINKVLADHPKRRPLLTC
ncbi:hypothetical protein QOZ80_9BG0710390 [Eleusine coracana subsp. coracana]|nr:hypothetical protein QOZ80_9BG0710390 [Eleusine coracana subsp. coracana]